MERQYPFTGIVKQDQMKLALILNVIMPSIGGVLIKGEKGTAKSTTVRSLADLMPELDGVSESMFFCDPNDPRNYCETCKDMIVKGIPFTIEKKKMRVVDLPVGATEDRVVGTIDIEHAIKHGEKRFEPGLLANAHRQFLYVDEINLLDDHIVDVLLDAAAMGRNTIEREGISYSHPARFVLVGTMNPEEGELRPQLLDRFGLSVEVNGEKEAADRVEVIKRRLQFEENPEGFIAEFHEEQEALREKIRQAQERLPGMIVPDRLYYLAAMISIGFAVEGHRTDITLIKTAQTLASFEGRTEVTEEDMLAIAPLVLGHRLASTPFKQKAFDRQMLQSIYENYEKEVLVK